MTKVLIAEDNAVNRELLRELLEARDCEVAEACDGGAALRMIESSRPDILLLDVGMPVLNGYELVRRIRTDPSLATLPVLAVTAYAMQGDRENILQSGFDGYLAKPIDSRLLMEEMERLLRPYEPPTELETCQDLSGGEPAAGPASLDRSMLPTSPDVCESANGNLTLWRNLRKP